MKTKILLTAATLLLFASFILPTLVSAQNLYGMTEKGGTTGNGVIFQFNPATSAYAKKFEFSQFDGYRPNGSLAQALDGNLYGMTWEGGSGGSGFGDGTLFQFNPLTSTYTKKLDFAGVNGQNPDGSLMLASDGNLYGMTYDGGTGGGVVGFGVIFQFNPFTSVYTKKHDFTGTDGANPVYTNLIEVTGAALVPTLSQWALITLSVLVLGAGVVFMKGRMA